LYDIGQVPVDVTEKAIDSSTNYTLQDYTYWLSKTTQLTDKTTTVNSGVPIYFFFDINNSFNTGSVLSIEGTRNNGLQSLLVYAFDLNYERTTTGGTSTDWLFVRDRLKTGNIGGTILNKFQARVCIIKVTVTTTEKGVTYTINYMKPDNTSLF
jgi:hypothetical protein